MKTKNANFVLIGLILASAAASLMLYPMLPRAMATHWGLTGEPDGFMSRFWAALFTPALMAAMFILFLILPKVDPLKHNVALFRQQYNTVVTSIIGFIAALHAYVLAWNLGMRFPVTWVVVPLMALLFFVIGSALPKMKQNWFMGIRTPWTMSSEAVWRKTHEHAGRIFQWLALVMIFGLLIPRQTFPIVIGGILCACAWVILYSYLTYKKLQQRA